MIPMVRPRLERPVRGFEHVDRFWDPRESSVVARIQPGEFYVTQKDEMVLTILGSCVSACIRDPQAQVGGMNHFMLPEGAKDASDMWNRSDRTAASTRYGNFAMERLINELLKLGARRDRLEVKIVGGGQMWASETHVGSDNVAFVLAYLRAEGLSIVAQDVGGDCPRRVHYYPQSGRMRVRKLRSQETQAIAAAEESYRRSMEAQPVAGDVELF